MILPQIAAEKPSWQIVSPPSANTLKACLVALNGQISPYDVPTGIDRIDAETALSEADARLRPVGVKTIEAGVMMIISHCSVAGITISDDVALFDAYRLMCATMPEDLFQKGVVEVLRDWRNTKAPPMPGHVWDVVKERHAVRVAQRLKITTLLRFGRFPKVYPPEPPVSAAEISGTVTEAMQAMRGVA